MEKLVVQSSAFENNGLIPSKYTCDGENVNPPLTIGGLPEKTKSLVLIVEDPDATLMTFDHWIVWNIPSTGKIDENSVPGVQGQNSLRKRSYGGPCPPFGTHRYFFKVYALDTDLSLPEKSKKKDVEKAMKEHVLAQGELMGLYRRKRS